MRIIIQIFLLLVLSMFLFGCNEEPVPEPATESSDFFSVSDEYKNVTGRNATKLP